MALRGGRRKFGEQLFDEAVEKIGLVRDVAIEGHRRHREALGYRGHGDRIKALFVARATASVSSRSELQQVAGGRTVLVQAEAKGPLVMCQSAFDQGSLVAFHANERIAEGASRGPVTSGASRCPTFAISLRCSARTCNGMAPLG